MRATGRPYIVSVHGPLLSAPDLVVADTAQRLGVPLVPVNGAAALRDSPQYRHRGFFANVTHPSLGTAAYPTVPYLMSGSPAQICRAAPTLGQHTADVLGSWLGISTTDVEALRRDGALG